MTLDGATGDTFSLGRVNKSVCFTCDGAASSGVSDREFSDWVDDSKCLRTRSASRFMASCGRGSRLPCEMSKYAVDATTGFKGDLFL